MAPVSASTGRNSSPQRLKMRVYVSYMFRYSRLASSSLAWNEYASFMMNSRPRMSPARGRISSRNLA